MRNQRFWYAAAAATVLLAAGCNGGGDNQPSPTPTPTVSSPTASPSDSGSPSPSASVSIPAEAMTQTPEGAVAFVKFYISAINEAWTTPSELILPPLQTSSCNSCAGFQEDAKQYVQKGQHLKSAPVQIEAVGPRAGGGGGTEFVEATVREVAVEIVDSAGAVSGRSPESTAHVVFALLWEGGQWQVNGVVEQ